MSAPAWELILFIFGLSALVVGWVEADVSLVALGAVGMAVPAAAEFLRFVDQGQR